MKSRDRAASPLALLWRAPLALPSFLLNKTAGMAARRMLNWYNNSHPEKARSWRTLSAETLKIPIALPSVMATGPRWNTHAIISTAGPLEVRRSIEIDVSIAARSAKSWTVVICTFPGMKTVTSIGSGTAKTTGDRVTVPLPAGRYWLALRYYRWAAEVELPTIGVDGSDVIPATYISGNTNDFYKWLIQKTSFFYDALHYYMWVLLQYQYLLPKAFVRREFLPLGNPDTEFFFGALSAGNSLCVEQHPAVRTGFDLYLTLYSRASFPLQWYAIAEDRYVTPPAGQPCSYLLRVQRARPDAGTFDRSQVSVTVVDGADAALASPRANIERGIRL